MQDRPATLSWLQSPVKSFYSFDFLTADEGGLLSLCTQPHRSFHDITSGGSRDIEGPGESLLIKALRMCRTKSRFC